MLPTFNDGDVIVARSDLRDLKRGDVIVFYYPKDAKQIYIERIVALPHETVAIRNNKIFINSEELPEPYVDENRYKLTRNLPPVQIPADHYFVMGDNREESWDSKDWGTLERKLIIGKYFFTLLDNREERSR